MPIIPDRPFIGSAATTHCTVAVMEDGSIVVTPISNSSSPDDTIKSEAHASFGHLNFRYVGVVAIQVPNPEIVQSSEKPFGCHSHHVSSWTPKMCRFLYCGSCAPAVSSIFTAVIRAELLTPPPAPWEESEAVMEMSFSEPLCSAASYSIANDAPPCGGTYAVYGNAIALPPVRTSFPMFSAATYSMPPFSPAEAETERVVFVERFATTSPGALV